MENASGLRTASARSRPALRMQMPAEARRHGGDLLNQQMWCWGSDIRRPEGNLLRAYGFGKIAAPEGSGLKPCYLLAAPGGPTIGLWGFGMYFADGGRQGVFLKRFEFQPRLVTADERLFDTWRASDLPALRLPECSADHFLLGCLLRNALEWVAAYESWVLETARPAYRKSTVDAWRSMRKKVAAEGPEMADAWRALASCHFEPAISTRCDGGHDDFR